MDHTQYLVFIDEKHTALSKPEIIEVPTGAVGHILATKEEILRIVANPDQLLERF